MSSPDGSLRVRAENGFYSDLFILHEFTLRILPSLRRRKDFLSCLLWLLLIVDESFVEVTAVLVFFKTFEEEMQHLSSGDIFLNLKNGSMLMLDLFCLNFKISFEQKM